MLICLHSSKGYDAIFATKVLLSYKGVYGTPTNLFISCIFNEIPILCHVYFTLKSYTISRQLFQKHTMNGITSLWNITISYLVPIPNTLSCKYQILCEKLFKSGIVIEYFPLWNILVTYRLDCVTLKMKWIFSNYYNYSEKPSL